MTTPQHPAPHAEFFSVGEFLEHVAQPQGEDQRVAAVLGRPIEHSKSPQLHMAAARAAGLGNFNYVRVEAGEESEIGTLLQQAPPHVTGFSVTMPGKTIALELADQVTERARRIGSANTLVRQPGGQWLADNTDVVGVQRCLEAVQAAGAELSASMAIIVGNGGTARPAVAALAELGVRSVHVVARSERALQLKELVAEYGMDFEWITFDAPDLAEKCQQASVLINTVPAEVAATYASVFATAGSIIDVIYDPYPTPLMTAAAGQQRPVADGLRMLAGQAEQQFHYFTGKNAPAGVMLEAVQQR